MTTALPVGTQDFPLTLTHVLRRMRTVNGAAEVVSLQGPSGRRERISFAELGDRIDALGAGLTALGVRPGDRVGTLLWNTREHLEAYYAVPCLGAVLHTVNPRLAPEEVAYTVNHAGDRVLLVGDDLVEGLAAVEPLLQTVEIIVVVRGTRGRRSDREVVAYETVVAGQGPGFEWPELGETAAAALCYTSGTSGRPKGVLYSHRALALHALIMSGQDVYGLGRADRVLAVVPMFHAMGWNLPFVTGLIGNDIVLPHRHLQPAVLAELIASERVTASAGVPTVWSDLLRYADEHGSDLGSLRRVLCGGSKVPETLMRDFETRHGVEVVQGWGMTETLSGAAFAHEEPAGDGDQRWALRATAGRVSPFYEARIVAEDGSVLPPDGITAGEIQFRGPVVAAGYFKDSAAGDVAVDSGWLRTGDIGTLDAEGRLRITDRAKDVIKSGGEWISSIELEAALTAHPDVVEAAVVAVPHPRWTERPLACLVLERAVEKQDLDDFLRARVARWWLPDRYVVVAELPRTSTGKLDKKRLRAEFADADTQSHDARYLLPPIVNAEPTGPR